MSKSPLYPTGNRTNKPEDLRNPYYKPHQFAGNMQMVSGVPGVKAGCFDANGVHVLDPNMQRDFQGNYIYKQSRCLI